MQFLKIGLKCYVEAHLTGETWFACARLAPIKRISLFDHADYRDLLGLYPCLGFGYGSSKIIARRSAVQHLAERIEGSLVYNPRDKKKCKLAVGYNTAETRYMWSLMGLQEYELNAIAEEGFDLDNHRRNNTGSVMFYKPSKAIKVRVVSPSKKLLYEHGGNKYYDDDPLRAINAMLAVAAGRVSKLSAWHEARKAVELCRIYYPNLVEEVIAGLGHGRYPEIVQLVV